MKLLNTAGLVLLVIARDPTVRLRDIARQVDITERTVWNAVNDLEAAGVISRRREGRRNVYVVAGSTPLEENPASTIAGLLGAVGEPELDQAV